MNVLVEKFERALLSVDRVAARRVMETAAKNLSPIQAAESLVVPTLERIGTGWENGTVALSQVYMSGRISEELVLGMLPPGEPPRKDQPRMAIAVLEDHHMLGKRIIYSVLRSAGYHLSDFGALDTPELVKRVLEENVDVLLISTLMLRSALMIKEVVKRVKAKGADVTVIVGGAPFRFDPLLWKEVGADAMGTTAGDALEIVGKIAGGDT